MDTSLFFLNVIFQISRTIKGKLIQIHIWYNDVQMYCDKLQY